MPESEENTKLLKALLALAVDEREQRAKLDPTLQATELLLNQAGLESPEIAGLMGKQPGAVRMTLSRARARQSGKGSQGGKKGSDDGVG
jgi:DNA-directed RNA polymerase specialized sigma24 family protein